MGADVVGLVLGNTGGLGGGVDLVGVGIGRGGVGVERVAHGACPFIVVVDQTVCGPCQGLCCGGPLSVTVTMLTMVL